MMQPGLSSILALSSVRCLTFNYSVVTGVPFHKFPGKLVSLRELKIRGCRGDPKATDGLSEQMPDLKIYGSIEAEDPAFNTEDHQNDVDLEGEENVGLGGADEIRDDRSDSGKVSDVDSSSSSDNESDSIIWDESSIPFLFLQDV
ncbi:uncharacterized protein LOC124552367 [Schistocerca americana]|uniref:uncharacterized protein LOC124552367 n=1 Tax=Schistocerca americana TaxID=7009 RepID=UPI001F4FF9B9|nr:uncharacterized protein LOC124552367 [Schistocerca americana]